MLPILPLLVFLGELLIALTCGMFFWGDSLMHRLGELTICFVAWLILARAVGLALSFYFAFQSLDPEQRQSSGAWCRTFLKEFWSVLLAFAIFIPLRSLFAPRWHQSRSEKTLNVVFVHGLLSNAGVWWWFDKRLKAALSANGQSVQADSLDLGPPFASIDQYVKRLDAHLQSLFERDQGPVVLIGHSMGGLVCRRWLASHPSGQVKEIVTIGTPHLGTRTAGLLRFPNLKQMRIASPWLSELSLSSAKGGLAIYSLHDNLVVPFQGGTCSAMAAYQCKGLGHLSLLFDSRVVDRVAVQLKSNAPSGLGA